MNRKLFAGVACLILGSCQGAQTPPAQSQWKAFAQHTVDQYFAFNPDAAIYQGDHRFDGQLPDWSPAGLKAQADFLHKAIADANGYKDLGKDDAFERDYFVHVAEGQLFFLEEADQPHTNPAFYTGPLDPNVYVSRDYADKPTRMKALTRFFDQVPNRAQEIRANLTTPMPASFVKYGVAAFDGFADYYAKDALKAFADVAAPEVQQRLKLSAAKASKAMRGVADWLRTQQGGATQNFALGPDKFSRMLQATEAVDIPLDQLMKVGRDDLARNQAMAKAECAKFDPGQPIKACFEKMLADKPTENVVAAATKVVPDLTAFVQSHDLVTIPAGEHALVREAPPYNRQNTAYIDPPGPLEHGIPSIYYIAPPDPAWSPQKQHDYLPGKDTLLFITTHEVMPGHFVQFLRSNRSPSLIGRLFVGYGFAEGWAHYAEQLMWDAGLGNGDPEVHIGQLAEALERDCRFISAIGLHTQGMTQEQSKKLFTDECYKDEGNAEQQAARGTYDPQYLNYTLNKLLIMKLRDDWTASRGGRKAWKQFHDTFLSFGGPPVPLVRQTMMAEATPKTVF
ncbi:MAG: DUF885 domain-containing protein [Croceibacterium sp.]